MLICETQRTTLTAGFKADSVQSMHTYCLHLIRQCALCALSYAQAWDPLLHTCCLHLIRQCAPCALSYAQAWDHLLHTYCLHLMRLWALWLLWCLICSSMRLIVPPWLFCLQYSYTSYSAHCALSHMFKRETRATHCSTLIILPSIVIHCTLCALSYA